MYKTITRISFFREDYEQAPQMAIFTFELLQSADAFPHPCKVLTLEETTHVGEKAEKFWEKYNTSTFQPFRKAIIKNFNYEIITFEFKGEIEK